MGYSEEERNFAVSELVQGTVSFKRDILGPRDTSGSFTETRELVNSTLLYEPDSIFYLAYIASRSLQKIVNDEVEIIDKMLDATDDLLKPNKVIEDVSSVAEISNALSALDSALGRSSNIKKSEFNRYNRAVERAKNIFGDATKIAYVPRGSSQTVTDIVRPANQAKKEITEYFASLKTQHGELLERVNFLLAIYDSFSVNDLATLVAKNQVSRAQTQMSSLYSQLSQLSPTERTEKAREALLKVVSNKSVISASTQAPVPGESKLYQGQGASPDYRISAYGSGSAPEILGTISAPYPIEAGSASNLRIRLNDEVSDTDIDLLPTGDSFIKGIEPAEIRGVQSGTFQIYGDLPNPRDIYSRDITTTFGLTSTTDKLYMVVDGTSYEITLPSGGADTVLAVVNAINISTLGAVVTASEVAGAVSGTRVLLEYTPASKPPKYSERHMDIFEGAENAVLGPYEIGGVISAHGSTPGYAVFNSGWDDNTELKIKANDNAVEETITLTAGVWTGNKNTNYIRTPTAVMNNINAQAVSFVASLDEDKIVLTSITKGEGSILTVVTDGLYSAGQPVSDPKEGTGTPSFNGALTLGFSEGQEDIKYDVDGKSIINLLNEDATFSDNATAKLMRTDYYRGTRVTKHASFDNGIRFASDSDITSSWPSNSELKLQILGGDNKGVYDITARSWSSGYHTFLLNRNLRDSDTDRLQEIIIYKEVIKISSNDSSTSGSLQVKNTVADSADVVLGFPLTQEISSVNSVLVEENNPRLGWVSADLRQKLIKVGDKIKNLSDGSEITSIQSIGSLSDGILQVSPGVDADAFFDTADGFTIESLAYSNFVDFKNDLDDWKDDLSPYEDADLEYIDKLLSPLLLVNASSSRVDSVYSALSSLKDKLNGSGELLEILQSYSVSSISQIDTALDTLAEQGHNRARKLLIKGDISNYLQTTNQNSSYGTALLKATSDVVTQDVNEPTNLNRHMSEDYERVSAEWYDDKNPVNDFSDIESDDKDPDALDFWEGID